MRRDHAGTWALLAAVLLLPLISMLIVPFYDTSEPRYAGIARTMAKTGDWITPWFEPGVPFWGKPPLSFWAQALSMKAFGFSEFAARLPSWLCLILSDIILIFGLRRLYGLRTAKLAALVYSTCALVYLCAGAVLTDSFLALGTTLSLISFAVVAAAQSPLPDSGKQWAQSSSHVTAPPSGLWRYGYFLGLAIGLLAKGPLALILCFAPVVAWQSLNRKALSRTRLLPWGKGFALVAALSLPWYVLAEIKTPGFLDYFIVGEHFRRFLDPGWGGDLYGTAHRQAYGTIWIYWLQATFPWGLLMLLMALPGCRPSSRIATILRTLKTAPLFSYWVTGALFTPLFFTFSANILWTYLLPSLASLSVITASFLDSAAIALRLPRRRLLWVAAIVPVTVLGLSAVVWIRPDLRNTERSLVRYVMEQNEPDTPLLYMSRPPFSAQYYSANRVQEIKADELPEALMSRTPFYLAIPKNELAAAKQALGGSLQAVFSNRRYILVRIPSR